MTGYRDGKSPEKSRSSKFFVPKGNASVPDKVDWRSKGYVTQVKDQVCFSRCKGLLINNVVYKHSVVRSKTTFNRTRGSSLRVMKVVHYNLKRKWPGPKFDIGVYLVVAP